MNKVFQSMRIAFRALRVNKLRSALTMLGIIIGVGAVIAMVSVGSGATDRIHQQIASIGSNIIMVQPGSQNTGGVKSGNGNSQTLTEGDAEAIQTDCPAVQYASPVQNNNQQIVYGSNNWQTKVYGVSPEYLTIRDLRIEEGEPFTTEDVKSTNKVALLGKTVVDNLFAGEDPIGKVVRIRKVPFTVVGTLVPKGQSSQGQDQDDIIIMPITTAKKKVMGGGRQNNWQQIGQIMAQARDGQNNNAMDQIEALLRQRHRLQATEDNDFQVRSLEEMAAAQEQATQIMGLLLASIASVSLIVGGIGIMNIMLVSVTERTREIGVRKALGATPKNILLQFLIEAVVLCLLGGVGGIIFGWVGALALAKFGNFNTSVAPSSILIAFFFSVVVVILLGEWPARRAASLDPIQSLRYE